MTFQGAGSTVVGWHCNGRGRGPKHFTEPAILWLAGMVMSEVGARNISRSQQYFGWLYHGRAARILEARGSVRSGS